tara:strand:+ start:739 stop:1272 length:534 start_codon:yes stop_codon:yes gene_type:complete
MKRILLYVFLIYTSGCNNQLKEKKESDSAIQLETDLEMYQNVWNTFLAGDTSVVNDKNFTEDIIIVTSDGDLVGIEACLEYYSNYLTGFSDIEWTIIDAFGQGNKLTKHWNFKGKHTGNFFGIPATGNKLNLSGTTIVTMRDGRIAKEHDFFDMKSMLDQLLNAEGDITVDEYQPVN